MQKLAQLNVDKGSEFVGRPINFEKILIDIGIDLFFFGKNP